MLWCSVLWCGVLWSAVEWCAVVFYGVWCGVVSAVCLPFTMLLAGVTHMGCIKWDCLNEGSQCFHFAVCVVRCGENAKEWYPGLTHNEQDTQWMGLIQLS